MSLKHAYWGKDLNQYFKQKKLSIAVHMKITLKPWLQEMMDALTGWQENHATT